MTNASPRPCYSLSVAPEPLFPFHLVVDGFKMTFASSTRAKHTFNGRVDLVIDVFYSVIDADYLVADGFNSVLNTVGNFQDLRSRHPCLLLRQSIKSAQSVLNISPAN